MTPGERGERAIDDVDALLRGHAGRTPICPPAESCVWKWIGMPTASRSALTSFCAAYGLSSPAMSLIARKWVPSFSSSLARFTK